jgi:hypothetical protein
MILEHSTPNESFEIEGNTFFVLNNVRNYHPLKKTYCSVEIDFFTPSTEPPKHVYFLIDSPSHMAVGHWFFESAVFLPYFKAIQERYPTIEIHLLERKNYKLILLDYFGDYKVSWEPLKENNICIIPSPIQSVHQQDYFELFCKNIRQLHTFCKAPQIEKSCEHLIMPRQKKENFIGNDRNYDREFAILTKIIPGAQILHTDAVQSFHDQIKIVRSAKRIYVSDGSAFLLNGFFATHSELYIVGNVTVEQSQKFKRYKFIIDMIKENNIVKR